jgi:hypothetical protein
MQVQQLQEQLARALKLPTSIAGTAARSILPGLIASRYVGFNASGEIVATTGTSVTATTKGDISVGTGAGVAALPVGARDQAIIADPDDANGLKWSDTTWRPNPIRRIFEAWPWTSQSIVLTPHPGAWTALYGTGSNLVDETGVYVNYTSAASLNAYAGPEWYSNNTIGQPRHRLRAIFRIQTPATITSARWFVGLGSARLGPAAVLNGEVACFRYDTGTDGTAFWRVVTNTSGGVGEVTTTTVAFTASTTYLLEIDYSGTYPKFYINNVLVATHSGIIPLVDAQLGPSVICYTLSTGARSIAVNYIHASSD